MSKHALKDGTAAEFRVACADDVPAVAELEATVYTNPINQEWMKWELNAGHGVVAFAGDQLVAHRLQRRMGPDILAAGMMVVASQHRDFGLGRALVQFFEATLGDNWKLSILVNSDGFSTVADKPDATRFWQSCGYELVEQTAQSRLLMKRL